jgi:hypothetical protein
MLIGLLLNKAWPLAILARAAFCELVQALKMPKIAGLKGAPDGLN